MKHLEGKKVSDQYLSMILPSCFPDFQCFKSPFWGYFTWILQLLLAEDLAWCEPLSQQKVEAGAHSFYDLNYKSLKPHIMIMSFFLTWILCPMVLLTKKECEHSSGKQICSPILRRSKEEQKSSSAGWGLMLFLASVIVIFTWSPLKHLHFRLKVGQKTSSDLRLHCLPKRDDPVYLSTA